MRIAVTGSSGLIGTALTRGLRAEGHEVLRLVRRPPGAADEIGWNPHPAVGGSGATSAAPPALEGIDAAVNLAGAPIASGRWTAARKHQILASRVEGTQALATLLAGLRNRPAALLSGSATGWYGNTGDRRVDESASPGSGFLAGVARDWEASTNAAEQAGIRVVHMRTGIVLSKDGGMLGKLLPLFRLGLGARLGPATQFMSWIMLADVVKAIAFLLAKPDISGPVNLTTPNPVTNAGFTAALAGALRRPAVLRVPTPVLDLALGEAASEILTSAQVLPARLLAAGYEFLHAEIEAGLASELATAHASGARSGPAT
jgi:uncharacterized protein